MTILVRNGGSLDRNTKSSSAHGLPRRLVVPIGRGQPGILASQRIRYARRTPPSSCGGGSPELCRTSGGRPRGHMSRIDLSASTIHIVSRLVGSLHR